MADETVSEAEADRDEIDEVLGWLAKRELFDAGEAIQFGERERIVEMLDLHEAELLPSNGATCGRQGGAHQGQP